MADIRINSLPTTASASSSDDFLALDGATNGTRKLNAYSPTFGGNLTVGSASSTTTFTNSANGFTVNSATGNALAIFNSSAADASVTNNAYLTIQTAGVARWYLGQSISAADGNFQIYGAVFGAPILTLNKTTGATTLAGNLTVSGGTATISTALAAGTQTINLSGGASTNGSIIANGTTGELRTSFGPSVAWGGFHTWYTDTTERMRLFANGNLGIGTGSTDGGQKLQVSGTGYFAGALIQLGNGTVDAIYRVTASNGKSSEFGDDTTGGFVRANNSQSLRFITGGTTALTLDTSQNATFAGNVRAGTVVGTAKTVIIDAAFTTLLNVTKTFTVTMPSPSLASSFVLEVGVYGNTATGYASLMVKGGGYLGSSTLYEATELTKINSGSVTISSVTKASGSMTFTVINTSSSGHVAICYKQTSDDVFTTLPTITAV